MESLLAIALHIIIQFGVMNVFILNGMRVYQCDYPACLSENR